MIELGTREKINIALVAAGLTVVILLGIFSQYGLGYGVKFFNVIEGKYIAIALQAYIIWAIYSKYMS